jgi:hypothetical protein
MSTFFQRTFFIALATCVAAVAFDAHAGGGHGGGGHGGHGGWGHGGGHTHWSVGVGIGFGYWPYYGPWGYWPGYYPYGYYPYGWAPGYAVAGQPVAADAPPSAPEPSFTPNAGQNAAQYELDRRLCDREAMASPAAMADASIFHRVVLVCMENRGYTVH